MVIHPWYLGLLAATGMERVAELRVSGRNAGRMLARGGREFGRGHYPWMVALHAALLLGCVAEPALAGRRFRPWPMLAVVGAAQALRWWCIRTLGERWCTRVIVPPDEPLVAAGPYRWLRHPNYLAVALEGMALPLVHSAWVTAIGFSALNAALLAVRIRCEEAALA